MLFISGNIVPVVQHSWCETGEFGKDLLVLLPCSQFKSHPPRSSYIQRRISGCGRAGRPQRVAVAHVLCR